MIHFRFLASLAILVSLCSSGMADVPVPNASFEEGDSTPAGWTLTRGDGGFVTPGAVGERAIMVSGDGKTDNAWLSAPLPLEADTVYRLRFQARRVRGGSGLPVSGPLFCNCDLGSLSEQWTRCESYFITPRHLDPEQTRLRMGQWEIDGAVAFDDVHIDRVVPVYRSFEGIELGDGEVIRDGRYTFTAPLGKPSANHARPLAWQQCHFNSNRFVLSSPDSVVVYRHQLERLQSDVTLQTEIGWHQSGELVVEASRDGQEWQELGTFGQVGSQSFRVPDRLLPAPELWIRFSARGQGGQPAALQLYGCAYEAQLDGEPVDLVGATQYFAMTQEDPQLSVEIAGMGDTVTGGQNQIDLRLRNVSDRPLTLQVRTSVQRASNTNQDTASIASEPQRITLPVGDDQVALQVPYALPGMQLHRLELTIDGDAVVTADTSIEVPALFAAHYGAAIAQTDPALGLWWCSSGWKISQQRSVPTQTAPAIQIAAAANEVEAAQLVLRPQKPLQGLTVVGSDLTGPQGARMRASCIEILQVGYVHVAQPTDAVGTVGPWPDPLPPLAQSVELKGGVNFPLWVRVHVPKGQPAGVYRGVISIQAEGIKAAVPLQVEVFGFELPDRMTCQTAFGFDPSEVKRYHRLESQSQLREVLDKYLRCLAAHHVSPYEPAPLDPIQVTWKNLPAWGGGERDTDDPHAGEASLKVADNSNSDNVSAQYQTPIPAARKGLRLSFWYRTAQADQPLLVTLRHFDAGNRWMSGRNNDMPFEGSRNWRHVERVIDRFPDEARSVQLDLRATLWNDEGSYTGTAWFDDVSVVNLDTDAEQIVGGGFESSQQPTPQPEFDFGQWDRAMTRAIDQLHFNTFQLHVPGLGGGTFHERYEPQLLGYAEDTPQYRAAMESYLGQLQAHLQDQGWLDEAFVYWFDEPDPKDYEFVSNGFAKLKRWAPGIRRMLTEQVEPALVGGPNIWCPLTASYDPSQGDARRAEGEEFWWYVCTGPKAPYCTLFIDHPATEMRVWLWQTWQRDIAGILVWATNYWSSSAAYPDRKEPQNPYRDPMSWVSGYSTPDGARRPWGNGDGRFLYPPLAAADGRPTRSVVEGPVESIRLEMLRDGIEDYEYLAMLRRLLASRADALNAQQRARYEALLVVPEEITSSTTTFTTDPAPLEQRRREVAAAITELSQRPVDQPSPSP